jgi:hypothetical protein
MSQVTDTVFHACHTFYKEPRRPDFAFRPRVSPVPMTLSRRQRFIGGLMAIITFASQMESG